MQDEFNNPFDNYIVNIITKNDKKLFQMGLKLLKKNAPIIKRYQNFRLLTKNTAEKDTFSAVFFYPSRRLGISSPQGVYHHALACISSPKVYSSAT